MTASTGEPGRRVGTIWMLNLDEPSPAVAPRLPVIFRQAEGGLDAAWVGGIGEGMAAEWQKRLAAGRQCYTAWGGDQLAAYGWVSVEEEHVGELNLRLRLLPGEGYIWDCATLPLFRGHHLYSALLAYIIERLRSRAFWRLWIGADLENIASQRGMARAGFHHVADLLVGGTSRQVWVEGLGGVSGDSVAAARRVFLGTLA